MPAATPSRRPPQQQREREGADDQSGSGIADPEELWQRVRLGAGGVVERRDEGVSRPTDQQLARGEAGDRDAERRGAGPRLPEHPGDAAACERHAHAEAQPARHLGHRKQGRPASPSCANQGIHAGGDQDRQEQQLRGDGDGERAQQRRAVLERRTAHGAVEAQAATRHHGARCRAGGQRGQGIHHPEPR
jgi:hypothetical protein